MAKVAGGGGTTKKPKIYGVKPGRNEPQGRPGGAPPMPGERRMTLGPLLPADLAKFKKGQRPPLPGRRTKPPTSVATPRPAPKDIIKKTPASQRSPFRPNVRLDPTQVTDRRGEPNGPQAGPNASRPYQPRKPKPKKPKSTYGM